MKVLSILTWNACSLGEHRRAELELKCSREEIDVVVICEAKRDEPVSGFDDYLQLVNNQTLMFVHKRLSFVKMDSYSIYQPFVETITILLEGMVLIGAYCRNGNYKDGIQEVLNMVEWLKAQDNPVCVIGDLNARCD